MVYCDCVARVLMIAPDQVVLAEDLHEFQILIEEEGKTRVPFAYWPLLCARCGAEKPSVNRVKIGEKEWDRYVQIDEREA